MQEQPNRLPEELAKYDLRIVGEGGCYVNFFHWLIDWLVNPNAQSFEEIFDPATRSCHGYKGLYLHQHRVFSYNEAGEELPIYNFENILKGAEVEVNYSIVRSHPVPLITTEPFNTYVTKYLEYMTAYGPTLYIDTVDNAIEIACNKIDKVPGDGGLERYKTPEDFYLARSYFKVEQINDQLKIVKMSRLINDTKNAIIEILNWAKLTPNDNINQLDAMIQNWKTTQLHLNKDQMFKDQHGKDHKFYAVRYLKEYINAKTSK